MFTLKSEIQFDMAHYLSGYVGKCKNIPFCMSSFSYKKKLF